MKVAFVMPALLPMPPVKGGAVEGLVDRLLRQNDLEGKLACTVFALRDEQACKVEKAYRCASFDTFPVSERERALSDFSVRMARKLTGREMPPDRWYFQHVLSRLKQERWDAIIVENVPSYALLISNVCTAPVYLHLHNRFLRPGMPWSARLATSRVRYLLVSDFLRREALQIEGMDSKKLIVLPNSVDVPKIQALHNAQKREELRLERGSSPEDVTFLYTGRLLPEKGVRELLTAFIQLNLPNTKLVIAGGSSFQGGEPSEYERELHKIAEKTSERVRFTGMLPFNKLIKEYAAADVMVVPAIWEEPAGLTVVEAMAAGLPVITTASGGIGEYCDDSCTLKIRRGEMMRKDLVCAMKKMADCPGLRKQMGQAGKWLAQQYTTEKCYDRLVTELKDSAQT